MSDDDQRDEWLEAVTRYSQCYKDLVALGSLLLDSGRDFQELHDTIEELPEHAAKAILTVSVAAEVSSWYYDKRQGAKLN